MTVQSSYDRLDGTIDVDLGLRDLLGTIAMTVWEDTPLQRLIPIGRKPNNRHIEMHVRDLAIPSAVNSAAEGSAASTFTQNLPDIISAGLHYARSGGYGVTGTDMALPTSWGASNTLSDQEMIKRREFAMEVDYLFWWSQYNQGTSAGDTGSGGTARRCSGIIEMLATTGAHRNAGTEVDITGTTIPGYSNSWLHDFGSTPMTVDSFNSAVLDPRVGGARIGAWSLFCSPATKIFIDSLMVRATLDVSNERLLQQYTRPIDSKIVGQVVDFLQTSFGIIPVVETRHLALGSESIGLTGSTYDYTVDGDDLLVALDMGKMSQHVLRPYEVIRHGKDADNTREWIIWEGAPNVNQPSAHAIFLHPQGTGS